MSFSIANLSGFPTTALYPSANYQGQAVISLQSWLVKNGFLSQADMNTGPGYYGAKTKAAVTLLQQALVAAGVLTQSQMNTGPGDYGPQTIAALGAELALLETPTLVAQTAAQTWTGGQSISFTLAANTFSDPQNENLTYTAALAGGGALPSWLTFNGATRTFSGTAPTSATNISIRVTATDTDGRSASETFSATVTAASAGPPTATVLQAAATLAAGKSISLASLFAVSDANPGRSVTAFAVRDRLAGGTGSLRFNGTTPTGGIRQSDGTILYDAVPISQLSQWTFLAGQTAETDTIGFQAIDDVGQYSTAVTSTVTTQAGASGSFNPNVVPGGTVSQDFAAHDLWTDVAADRSKIPANEVNSVLTHPAVDIVAPLNTPVDAFAGGVVTMVSSATADSFLGYYLLIKSSGAAFSTVAGGQDFYTLYVHLAAQPNLTVGQSVATGAQIGTVGTTGNEKGMKAGNGLLHFEIRLFASLYQPYQAWFLPKTTGPSSNIYLYGSLTAQQLLADPDPNNPGKGYVDPRPLLSGVAPSSPPQASVLQAAATVSGGRSIALSSLFSYSDPSPNRSVVAFAVRDRTPGGTGALKYNGATPANGIANSDGTILYDNIPISQLSQWTFQAGATAETDTIGFQAIDDLGGYSNKVVSVVTTQAAQIRATLADFNADGRSDILWRNSNGDAALWNATSSGQFSGQSIGHVSTDWKIAGVGDFNGDNKADILWMQDGGRGYIYNSTPSGLFAGQDLGQIGSAWKVAGVGDFNGDSKSDIVWRNDNGAVYVYNSTASGVFSGQDLGTVETRWKIVGVGDFNNDSRSDILWRTDLGDVAIWYASNSGVFSGQYLSAVGAYWKVAGVGDFNGDSSADILWRGDGGEAYIWNSNGSGGFVGQDLGVVDKGWKVAQVADYNGDHKADILWRNDNGAAYLYNSTGSSHFSGQDLGFVSTDWKVQA